MKYAALGLGYVSVMTVRWWWQVGFGKWGL